MTATEIFGIICFMLAIILCGIAGKECRECLNYTDSISLRVLLKVFMFLYTMLILLSILFIYIIIIY